MGIKDTENLHKIYEKVKAFCKENNLPYRFKVDDGSYETAIEFIFLNAEWETFHPPIAQGWEEKPIIICPDLLDYHHKKIIEFEEEGRKKRSGVKLATKGHGRENDLLNKKDTRRNDYYKWGKFQVLQFYETDLKVQNWQKLYDFL